MSFFNNYNERNKILKQINKQNNLESVKSKYILELIFSHLQKNKYLEIIKYNKNAQNRLNINSNDFKEYFEIFTSIEIEITFVENQYGKYINIVNEDEEPYFHKYFNDNKIEIDRNYTEEDDKISKIKIVIDYPIKSFEKLFEDCPYIQSISFKKFNRININNMNYMFCRCSSLNEINLSNFKTNNVIYMDGMFFKCSSLKKLYLSNFNTINVTDMNDLFNGCSSLKEINCSNFNTDNVVSMAGMFSGCTSLEQINLPNFNTDKVTNMAAMFSGCSSLK